MRITKVKVIASEPLYLDDLFDAKNGHGAVPNSESIDYFGFTVYMHPSEFLSLSTKATLNPSFYENCIKNGEPLGYPFLSVFEEDGMWKIWGHEGRHRMQAIKNVLGDNHLVPVHIFPRDMRNRNLTPELLAMPFLPERTELGNKTMREAWNLLHHFKPEMIDVKSKYLNVGKKIAKISSKHPALANRANFQSDLIRSPSPTTLRKTRRSVDKLDESLQDNPQEMRVYKNGAPAPQGTSVQRRCN